MNAHIAKIAAVALAMTLTAGSAHADAGRPPALVKPANESPPKAETRYCIKDTVTGSRIPLKACYTRRDWLARGFDPLAPKD